MSATTSWQDSVLNWHTEARRQQDECPTWLLVVPEEANAAEVAAGVGCPTKGMYARHGYFLRPGDRRHCLVRAANGGSPRRQVPSPLLPGGPRRGALPAEQQSCSSFSAVVYL